MASYVFAYDEPVICRACGGNDFTLLKSTDRLRCNGCLTSYTERELVDEAVEIMSGYIQSNGITEKLNPSHILQESPDSTLAAMLYALQVLSYPQSTTLEKWMKAIRRLRIAVEQERQRAGLEIL